MTLLLLLSLLSPADLIERADKELDADLDDCQKVYEEVGAISYYVCVLKALNEYQGKVE